MLQCSNPLIHFGLVNAYKALCVINALTFSSNIKLLNRYSLVNKIKWDFLHQMFSNDFKNPIFILQSL